MEIKGQEQTIQFLEMVAIGNLAAINVKPCNCWLHLHMQGQDQLADCKETRNKQIYNPHRGIKNLRISDKKGTVYQRLCQLYTLEKVTFTTFNATWNRNICVCICETETVINVQ